MKHTETVPDANGWVGNTKATLDGYRMEAIKVTVTGSTVELPAYLVSPLAKNFTYYQADFVSKKSNSGETVYDNNSNTKSLFYSAPLAPYIKVTVSGSGSSKTEEISDEDAWKNHTSATQKTATSLSDYNTQKAALADGTHYFKMACLSKGDDINQDADIYVTYEYDPDNDIAKLDGTKSYNIKIGNAFLALNRGRNNRPALMPNSKISPEFLTSEDFVTIKNAPGNASQTIDGTGIQGYWKDDPYNDRDEIGFQFHFLFKYYGLDPYNIIICSAYNRNDYYIEKVGNSGPYKKWYKGSSLFAENTANSYVASDDNKFYNQTSYSDPNTEVTYDDTYGYFHGLKRVWNSFALLNAVDNKNNIIQNKVVFMVTRTVKDDGTMDASTGSHYYLSSKDNGNNIYFQSLAKDKAPSADREMYETKTINFKVKTQFNNIVSASVKMSEYTLSTAKISDEDIPASLRRKYCNITGYYKDAALTDQITKYSDLGESTDVYIGYEVLSTIPFKAINNGADYNTATWYELTDAGSTQESGKKLEWNESSSAFKNNGAAGDYKKESEFAFVGDPYELKVLYRKDTETAKAYRYVTLSEHTSWDIPGDEIAGSFLLRKYDDTGHWNWDAGHESVAVTYETNTSYDVPNSSAQTITFNISGLTVAEGNYIKVTGIGGNSGQVTATTPTLSTGIGTVASDGTAVVTAAILARGDTNKSFTITIQEYNSSNVAVGTPTVITVNQKVAAAFAGNALGYSTSSSTYIRVMELPTCTFTYKIVDLAGNVAVAASATQTIFSPLSLASIPSIIISPFLYGETLTFYQAYSGGVGREHLSTPITQTPSANADIYVKYTTTTLSSKAFTLSENQEINVKLNGEYLYCEKVNDVFVIKTKANPSNAELTSNAYLWYLRGRDPYLMLIDNKGATAAQNFSPATEPVTIYNDDGTYSSQTRNKGMFVHVASWTDGADLAFSSERSTAAHFIAKLGANNGLYEVMAATGADVDARTTYYNIGRSSANTVKMYKNTSYAHNDNVLKFELEVNRLITYHLIDKTNTDLLQVESRSPELVLPSEFQSPLVSQYHYYTSKENATSGTSPISSMPAGDNVAIYVTYDTDEQFGFGTRSPYMLKFLNGKSYYLEDGNDKLTATKMKAMYPYCNGDGSLNIYGAESNEEQMSGGSSTRPRWVWFLESDNNDPYHVKIHSRSTITFNGTDNSTYLQTFAVHFNQDTDADTKHIVTGGNLAGISQVSATEYMVLGEVQGGTKKYKLLTTNKIAADLNGDGDTDDTVDGVSENARRYVTSFEQYWKTYNMVKQHVLGISKEEDEFSENPETFVMPSSKWSELKTKLGSGEGNLAINDSGDLNYVDNCSWHSYKVVANATRWNGYNDKEDGKEKKVVEELEHWFQTFDMGDGTFEIESADIPPVLVLLDRHGWEIVRKTLPTGTDPNKIAALKAYDSPMVKEYKFYNNATKASGCHKYTLRLDDKGEERDQIKVDGKHFTSTSLGTLPTLKADKYGTYSDVYVTYTVKDEYEKSYKYNLTTDTTDPENPTYTETGTPSKFLVIQNARFARTRLEDKANYFSKPVAQGTKPTGGNVYNMILSPSTSGKVVVDSSPADGTIDDINLWYVQPNLEIDDEMGIPWASKSGGSSEPLTKYETKVKYKDQTGFDPYNIQLKNVSTSEFYTINLTSTTLTNGVWEGTLGSEGLTLEAKNESDFVRPEGYDHTRLNITKQTFMAVSDANGNMQLMPRFDNTKRVDIATGSPYYTTLKAPKDHNKVAVVTDNSSMGTQTVFLVRPQVLDYRIIDNDGNEALRYKNAGEYSPSILEKFKSPLATDFKYYFGYTTNTITEGTAKEWEDATELYKRTALTDALVTSQAKLLPATGDYYFRIGTNPNSYSYKKVSVTEVNEITSTFAEAGVDSDAPTIYVRYSYDESADDESKDILQGKWFTMNLAGKDVQADGTLVKTAGTSQGTGVSLYSGTKPGTVDGDDRIWQWKFITSPTDISSPYYRPVDPYAVQFYNREKNYSNNLDEDPNPMSIGIKVSDGGGTPKYYDHFAILSHPNGDYALAVTGLETYSYSFLNGANMTIPSTTAASIVEEIFQKSINQSDYDTEKGNLTKDGVYYFKLNGVEATDIPTYTKVTRSGGTITADDNSEEADWEKAYISPGARLILNDDVEHNYQYNVITNKNIVGEVNYGSKLAIRGTQDKAGAELHNYVPYLPENMQTHLLNEDDYLYYGGANIVDPDTPDDDPYDDTYTMADATKLITLHGLYDDVVYVRYKDYSMDKTNYDVPNKKAVVGGKVVKDPASQDVAININDGLPYNIFWENHNMMRSTDDTNIIAESSTSQNLSGNASDTWQFAGNDPYALKIKHKNGNYVYNSSGNVCTLDNKNATLFMLLKNDDYDYGVLQKTSDASAKKLTFGDHDSDGSTAETLYLSTGNPKYFIIFGLSTHKLIYHLVINTTNQTTSIPYREGADENSNKEVGWEPYDGTKHIGEIPGTTQRDLISMQFGVPGDKYQLGSTIMGQTYCVDAGEVSIGDVLKVPKEFDRPNCVFLFYIDNIQKAGDAKYKKGSDDAQSGDYIQDEDAMNTSAAALTETGDYYYKISAGKIYRKVRVTSVSPSVVYEVSGSTKADYDAAANKATVASEALMETAASSLVSVGDYYYEIGPLVLYKKVHVTTAKVESTPAVYTVVDCTEDDWTNAWQDYTDMNNRYKGLKLPVQSPRLMSDAGLIGCLVKVNVAYAFQTGLETNAGEGFVTSVGQNLWYTFETFDKKNDKSYLAHYTNAWGLQAMEGRETHYTNDYLWTPLGDVYGFRMYNRYMIKNSGGVNNVMTMPTMTEETNLKLAVPGVDGIPEGYEVFELLLSNTSGSFRIHPVINNSGTQYYIWKDPADDYAKISTNYSEWTFALGTELLKPYIDRVGYVGGLKESSYTANKAVLDKVMDGTASYADLLTVQEIVYNDANIVPYTPGYYRLHSQPDVSGMNTVRYASGYLHSVEKGSGPSTAIPLHFYSRIGTNTTFEGLESGFKVTDATRGPIPIPATEYDPSTIFYFAGAALTNEQITAHQNPTSTMQTQGLYVAENEGNGLGTNREKRVVMSTSSPLTLTLMDIGGAVLLIHDGADPADRKYLNFDQSNFFQRTVENSTDYDTEKVKLPSIGDYYFKIGSSTYKKVSVTALDTYAYSEGDANETDWTRAADIYDLKYYHDSPTDDAKWCMAPADSLLVETHSGGDGHYYATFYAPFDLKLPENVEENKEKEITAKDYYAYICTEWNTQSIHPIKTGNEGKDIPAGTPVIIRTTDTEGYVKLSFPATSLSPVANNIFTGSYLEQLLSTKITAEDKVYTMGLPITGYGLETEDDESNGNITGKVNGVKDYTGVGFYINANPNKELSVETGQWEPNNRYVLHNRIYYRASGGGGSGAPAMSPEFVPVIFDDLEEEQQEELNPSGEREIVGDGCVYDLMGRKVATREQVEDGSWKQRVASGIYIINGKKIRR